MTIQSTCHPHSQAASSSLLTNEGGGVGEAEGVAEGDRHTDAGKETGKVARPKARPRVVHGQTAEGRRREGGSQRSDRKRERALQPGHVA